MDLPMERRWLGDTDRLVRDGDRLLLDLEGGCLEPVDTRKGLSPPIACLEAARAAKGDGGATRCRFNGIRRVEMIAYVGRLAGRDRTATLIPIVWRVFAESVHSILSCCNYL